MSVAQRAKNRPALLCVANYPAGTGFAWTFIQRIYADIAGKLASNGIETYVAYPRVEETPKDLRGTAASVLEQRVHLNEPADLLDLVKLVRKRNIWALYLTDRPTWHPAYAVLRMAGVRWIVVHDHTSGARTRPAGLKRMVKRLTRRLPGMLADRVVAVSDYVARRKIEVDLVPSAKVVRVWNGIEVPSQEDRSNGSLAARLGIHDSRPVIACACRAVEEKGVHHLLRAFARLRRDGKELGSEPVLVYLGDGPALGSWKSLVAQLGCEEDVVFTGYREDADELVGMATVAVVPSVWEEAFGLSALEPMARGVPVVASCTGGLPEVVADGETGVLVPPADEAALADALYSLLTDEKRRAEMGTRARRRAAQQFAWDDQITAITDELRQGFE